ncbi:MAG TPA: cytochrome P450 [Tepidisphaeraceae bacterium]|nr:cytochrome P450 [Tepidisphaeraceae bacterium]
MDLDLFSDDARRNPYPIYEQIRAVSSVLREPTTGIWMVFDYETVKRILTDWETFSSKYGPPGWMIFLDPPRHTKLRALVAKAFTPRSVGNLELRITELVRGLLESVLERGEMDLAADFAVPLPMMVIAEMLGIPTSDRAQFKTWVDIMVAMSHAVLGTPEGGKINRDFLDATKEMAVYLARLLEARRRDPMDDLLTRLLAAEVDGERLGDQEILGFFQLLLLAGSETTTNLINNAILCFIEHPGELARLRADLGLLPSAIEEVLRFRSPLQWFYRLTTRQVELHGQQIPDHTLVFAVVGSANRDPQQFPEPNRFDITRDPNPHIAFGHGGHFCLGAPLARLEARIALGELLSRTSGIELASSEPWEPRKGQHVHGPTRLPIRFKNSRPN